MLWYIVLVLIVLFFVVMSDDRENEQKRAHVSGEKGDDEPPDVAKKRPRGPSDCLNWSDSEEEEFVPFTQSNPEPVIEPVKKVFAKKSAPKKSATKNPVSKGPWKGKSRGRSDSSKSKMSGKWCFYLTVCCCNIVICVFCCN